MTREQIEKAAVGYAEKIPQSDERREYSREDFIAGAKWRINSVFHKVSEEPEDEKFPILVEYSACGIDGFCFTVCDDALDYDMHRHLSYCTVLRWAYISDLLPERKEESK